MHHDDLFADLDRLAGSLDRDPGDHLLRLTTTLQRTASGFVGLTLTIVHSGHPVHLTSVLPGRDAEVSTSLGMSLGLLSPTYEAGGRVAFYSTVSGAFVDLAADLTYVLDRARTGPPAVELDADLPLTARDSMMTGLEELATLNRAAGVLISRGQHPNTVHDVLRNRASAAGLTPLALAWQILGRTRG